ncbi:hypothetical protein OG413_45955 [Streptomyces sp. NBC_01433]|uniref:hypothetical protein n=1 Tax=Streptomyces sp. NBC_01433 TaxID=2903864 RepID=UPI002250EDE7|nr:hypothetical protein [Streptomyces sp. NBC_01433]MCX4682478.1 hypothetical protein [Streptomyces sp. NBC_01433]MCX4682531.1 hypothetical protein [Streptomyces sp. NBC_01433]
MTAIDRTPNDLPRHPHLLVWVTTLTPLVSIVAVVVLALTHNAEAATAVGAIGGAVTALGGTANLRSARR